VITMRKIKCCIDKQNAYTQKPKGKDIGAKIQPAVLRGQGEYEIKELAQYIEKGYSYTLVWQSIE
jgi:hypothetical protein